MEEYPLNPWTFVVVFVALMSASSLVAPASASAAGTFLLFGPAFALLLQYFWCWQVLRFVSALYEPARKYRKRFLVLLMLAATGLIAIAIARFAGGYDPADSGDPVTIIDGVAGMIMAAFAIAAFWNPAAALCKAEDGAETPPSRIVGTFLLFFYLVIGAPFVYRRLEALGSGRRRGFADGEAT